MFRYVLLTKPGPGQKYPVLIDEREYQPGAGWWGFPPDSMKRLIKSGRIASRGSSLESIKFLNDFPYTSLDNVWTDTATGSGTAAQSRRSNARYWLWCLLPLRRLILRNFLLDSSF